MVKLKIVSAQTDFHTVVDLDEFIHVISFVEENFTCEDLTFVRKLLCLFSVSFVDVWLLRLQLVFLWLGLHCVRLN